MIMTIKLSLDDHIIRYGKYYLAITQNSEYKVTFIKSTNIPDNILEELFGDVREGKFSKYLPYLIQKIDIYSNGILIYGLGNYTIHRNIFTFNNNK